MAHCDLKFNSKQAIRYQLELVNENLKQEKEILKTLQQHQNETKELRLIRHQAPESWQPLFSLVKIPNPVDLAKKVEMQSQIVTWMTLKQSALNMAKAGETNPEMWARQHFLEMQCAEKFSTIHPGYATLIEALYKRIRISQYEDSKAFKVIT